MTAPADGELERMLDEMESKAKAATPGPWLTSNDRRQGIVLRDARGYQLLTTGYAGDYSGTAWPEWHEEDDAKFVAAANPAVILALLAAVRARLKEDEDAKAEAQRLRLMIVALYAPAEHFDGCLWKADHRMPCQCGWHNRRLKHQTAFEEGKKIAATFDYISGEFLPQPPALHPKDRGG